MNRPILLPYPDRRLSPNARMNRYALNMVRQEARETGFYYAKENGEKVPHGVNLQLFILINPPDNRARDDDNVLASLKSYRDGIFDALAINDSSVKLSTHGFGKVIHGGRVCIWIEQLVEIPEWMKEV